MKNRKEHENTVLSMGKATFECSCRPSQSYFCYFVYWRYIDKGSSTKKNENDPWTETCYLFLGVVCSFISVTILLSLIVDHQYLAILEYFCNFLFWCVFGPNVNAYIRSFYLIKIKKGLFDLLKIYYLHAAIVIFERFSVQWFSHRYVIVDVYT